MIKFLMYQDFVMVILRVSFDPYNQSWIFKSFSDAAADATNKIAIFK